MKIICDCGAKYGFDPSPEMLRNPLVFSCPTCGVELTARIAAAVREQFPEPAATPGELSPALEIAPPPAAATAEAPPAPIPVPKAPPAVRLSHGAGHRASAPAPDVVDARFCGKHPQQRVTEKCRVCGKAICPLCMNLFGYVCSAHCKEKAELQGIKLPKYAAQRDEVQRQQWAKVGLVVKLAAALIVTGLGVWFWYAWFGSRPRPVFAVRFEDDAAMSGNSALVNQDQLVFIHGAKLARYDLKKKSEVWRVMLLDRQKLTSETEAEFKRMQERNAQSEYPIKLTPLDKLIKMRIRSAEAALDLRVHEQNIWVSDGEKVRAYDWQTGAAKQEIEFPLSFAQAIARGAELEFKESVTSTRLKLTRFNLATGQVQREEIGAAPKPVLASAPTNAPSRSRLPGTARPAAGGTANPQQLAAAVANASLAGRLAAPATISVARNQQQALDFMEEMEDGRLAGVTPGDDEAYLLSPGGRLIPTGGGNFAQLTIKLLEKNLVGRSAAKAAPKKSALDGPVNASATMDIANELLNEMSRNAGADRVIEDLSKYQVKIHLGGSGREIADWEGEVVGPPALYPQTSVNVLVAGKTVLVLDQNNQKKWQTTLNYPLAGGGGFLELDAAERRGLGPVVERGDTLYVYDQGVLSAFELATGEARWRLPSVGITGMFFDDAGMIYLNTTTASPEKIKYSRQIDVTDRTAALVLKLDPKNGKEIWKHDMGGNIAYLKGKFIYTLSYTEPRDDDDEWDENLAVLGLESKPYIRIRRISPKNGRVLWDHYQPRGALDIQIHDNTFQLVLKKEVQVLRFLAW